MKSVLLLFLAAVSTHTLAFAPSPALRVQRPVSVTTSKTIAFMVPPVTEEKVETPTEAVNGASGSIDKVAGEVEELSETQKLMKQVKESGTAGIVSYALWELAFWFFSVPVCIFGYREVTG